MFETAHRLWLSHQEYSIRFRILRPDGEVRWLRSAAHIERVDDVPIRAVGFVVDITEERRDEIALQEANRALSEERAALNRQILEDGLTGIANRRFLDQELDRMCRSAQETGAAICLGMIDVDHFKGYNDRYGHLFGDEALRRIAGALQQVVRRSGVVARYGGEEFVFVLVGIDDPAQMIRTAQAAIADLDIRHDRSPEGRLTISGGCVTVPQGAAANPRHLLQEADQALYAAKSAGRDRFVVRIIES